MLVWAGLYPADLRADAVFFQAAYLDNYALDITKPYGVPSMPLWSLAVEEHFYLLFPLFYLFLAKRFSPKQQATALLAICGAVLALRFILALTLPDYHALYNWTHTRIDSLLYGCILAVWSNPVLDRDQKSYVPRFWQVGLACAVMLLCLLVRPEFFRQTLRYSLQGMALFVLFSYAIRLDRGLILRVLTSRIMKILGLFSYTMYLAHFFILNVLWIHFPATSHLLLGIAGFALTVGYAAVMYVTIERPMARRRARLH